MVDKVEDLPKVKGLVFGYSVGTISYIFISAKELANIPADKVVLAYTGSGDARRAFLAGEINCTGESSVSYNEVVLPFVAKGEITHLFQSGLLDSKGDIVKDPVLPPDMLTFKELYDKIYGKSPSGTPWDAYKATIAGGINYQKIFLLPPGTPDGILTAYWNAAEAMLKDPEFIKAADLTLGKNARWAVGQSGDQEFKLNYRMAPQTVEWFRVTMQKYGVIL